jgi:hypothetical protein
MKTPLLFLLTIVAATLNICYGQTDTNRCEPILINDSTFKHLRSSPYSFGVLNDHVWKSLRSVNDYEEFNKVISIENNCLKFTINYGCGWGEIQFDLLTDGLVKKDEYGNNYADLKFILIDKDSCERMCWNHLSYDLSILTDKFNGLNYLKFDQVAEPIILK